MKRPWKRPDVRELRIGSGEQLVEHIAVVRFLAPRDNLFNGTRIAAGVKAGTRCREPFELLTVDVMETDRR